MIFETTIETRVSKKNGKTYYFAKIKLSDTYTKDVLLNDIEVEYLLMKYPNKTTSK